MRIAVRGVSCWYVHVLRERATHVSTEQATLCSMLANLLVHPYRWARFASSHLLGLTPKLDSWYTAAGKISTQMHKATEPLQALRGCVHRPVNEGGGYV